MTDTLITDVQQGIIDQLSTSALDAVIWDYLNNPNNGFMDSEQVITTTDATALTEVFYPPPDATSADTTAWIYLDTTSVEWVDTTSLWTVEEWKETYLETTNNDAMITIDKIGYTDSNSPNYPLVDWQSDLFSFDTTTSVDFNIVADSTAEYFIQYEHRVAKKIDGMYIQPGLNGVDSTTGEADIAFYIGYSFNGVDWVYIADDSTIYTNQQDAIDDPIYINYAEAEITPQNVSEVMFTDTAIEAKYWRIYFVEGTLGSYTASLSHLRFEQIREHGEALISKSMPLVKNSGEYATGISNESSGSSGASWFSTLEFTYTFTGAKEAVIDVMARGYCDSTAEFRIRTKNESGAWTVRDSLEINDNYANLIYSGIFVNPSNDLTATWTIKVDIQDRSPAGTPTVDYRLVSSAAFRSAVET